MTGHLADLTSHKIEGIAAHGDTPFSVPLISHIAGNLYMGGCPVPVAQEGGLKGFRFIVNLYPWELYAIPQGTTLLMSALYDSGDVPDRAQLDLLARFVHTACELGPTLVHCQAGLNRSGLVCALALIGGGMPPAGAIELLREKRCDAVLCNQAFETYLLSLPIGEASAEHSQTSGST